MEDLLISTLESLKYPVYLQGSATNHEKSVFTFWNDDSNGSSFYNNDENAIVWEYSVNFYSDDPVVVNSILFLAKSKLKEVGFIVNGGGYDIPSDEPGITGRGIDITFIQKL